MSIQVLRLMTIFLTVMKAVIYEEVVEGGCHLIILIEWLFGIIKERLLATLNFGHILFLFWPIVVGLHGLDPTHIPSGAIYNPDPPNFMPVEPASLYEAQLKMRLGSVPSWLRDLHTEWNMLKNSPLHIPKVLFMKEGGEITMASNESVTVDINDYLKVLYAGTDYVEENPYTITSSDESVVTVIKGEKDEYNRIFDTLTFTGEAAGTANVTLTGRTDGQEVTVTFNVICLGFR